MTNAELTLDQLTAMSGGVTMGPDGSTCTDCNLTKFLKNILGSGTTGPSDAPKVSHSQQHTPPRTGFVIAPSLSQWLVPLSWVFLSDLVIP